MKHFCIPHWREYEIMSVASHPIKFIMNVFWKTLSAVLVGGILVRVLSTFLKNVSEVLPRISLDEVWSQRDLPRKKSAAPPVEIPFRKLRELCFVFLWCMSMSDPLL